MSTNSLSCTCASVCVNPKSVFGAARIHRCVQYVIKSSMGKLYVQPKEGQLSVLHVSLMKTVAVSLIIVTLGELLVRERINCSGASGRSSSSIVTHTHCCAPFIEPEGNVRIADKER